MSRILDEIRKRLAEVTEIYEDDELSDQLKYRLVFRAGKKVEELVGRFDYYDPDTTYDADTRAYYEALVEHCNRLLKRRQDR